MSEGNDADVRAEARARVRRALKFKMDTFTAADGTLIHVRGMSRPHRSAFIRLQAEKRAAGDGGAEAEIVAAFGLCDEQGRHLYAFDNEADLTELREEFDGGELERIALMVFELSGLTKQAQEQAEKK